jgi:hypothetical protein
MKVAKAFTSLAAVLVLMSGAVGAVMAQDNAGLVEPGTFDSHVYVDMGTGLQYTPKHSTIQLAGDVYNNTNPQAAANFGFSSTDLASQWGDRVTTTGTGILQENDFTVFNTGSSAGTLLSATFNIALNDGSSLAALGGYTTGLVTFGSGLPPGFFSIITITGIGGLNINVNTTDVLIRQQIATKTGLANRLGIASLDPPTIGSSSNTMYINSSTVGPAGFYNVGNPPQNANPGYRINLSAPVAASKATWGSVKALYHN